MGSDGWPVSGRPAEEVLARMDAYRRHDADWRRGRTFSLVYHADQGVADLARRAYEMFMAENALSPVAFPSLRRFEADVVRMTADLLGGGPDVAGTMTSGGSESILLAVKTARDWGRAERGVFDPEMVLPVTAHPAFLKAAHYFGVRAVVVPVGRDLRADVEAVRRAVSPRTVLIVGSAPAYPHGVVDPIEDMARVAAQRGTLFHTDACLGGFLLPFLQRLGRPIPPFGLDVPGVTSVSADVHKYGYAAKGASVILYRDAALRRHQFFACTDWPGGLYGSPGLLGTRPGGAIAAAWAVMNHLGEEGYLRLARRVIETADRFRDGIEAIPGMRILGDPPGSVMAFTFERGDVYRLGDEMERRGWHLDRQQLPPSLHLMLTPAHERVVDDFLRDLREAADEVERAGDEGVSGMAAIYGMAAALPERGEVRDLILDFLGQLLDGGGGD